jgi:hypothetical protein
MASSPDRYVERRERGREIITGEFRSAYPWMVPVKNAAPAGTPSIKQRTLRNRVRPKPKSMNVRQTPVRKL